LASYRIFETNTFKEDLARICRSGLGRFKEKLQKHIYPRLREEPHFGPNIKRLRGWHPPTWRVRIGGWRFFYEIEEREHIVYMNAADHRGKAYS
jgi:mRNA interferase RelE/StbE